MPVSSFEWNPPRGVLSHGNSTVEMSIQIGHRMASLSLADAEATSEKDLSRGLFSTWKFYRKHECLTPPRRFFVGCLNKKTPHIHCQDKRMIHDLVVGEMESFDHIDRVLKKCIGEALSQCEKSVSRQFSDARLVVGSFLRGSLVGVQVGHIFWQERVSDISLSSSHPGAKRQKTLGPGGAIRVARDDVLFLL